MTKKWIAINLVLLAAAGLLGWQLFQSVKRFQDENNIARLARLQVPKKKAGTEAAALPARADSRAMDADYSIIPAQNLFADTRRMEVPVENIPVVEPQRKLDFIPVLVGITIAGSQRTALINDPTAGNAAGAKRYQKMRLGDHYRGFVVTDITENSMVLEYGSSREIIPLYDTSKPPAQSGKTPILATRVVNFGAGGTGAVANAMINAPARTAAGAAIPVPQAGAGGARTQPITSRPQPGGQGAVPQTTISVSGGGMAPGPTWNTTIDRQGNTIVNSPFGQFTLPSTPIPAQPVKK